DHVPAERGIERSDERAVIAARVHQRDGAHRVSAGAVRVEPLALARTYFAAGVDGGPGAVHGGAPVVALHLHGCLAASAARPAAKSGSSGAAAPSQSSIAARACPTSMPSPPRAARPLSFAARKNGVSSGT